MEVIGQKLSKLSILAKNGQILVLNGQIFAISEFSRHIEYDFLKENHKTYGRTDARTDESEFIGSFRSLKTSGEPKIRKINSGVRKL